MSVMMIFRTDAGAALPRLVMSGWVADLPRMPSRDTRTRRPGKIDWMPKYVRAAARSCRSSALYSFSARLAAASQDPPLRAVGVLGASSRALLPAFCDLAIGDDLLNSSSARGRISVILRCGGCRPRCRGPTVPDPARRAPSWRSRPWQWGEHPAAAALTHRAA